MQNNYEDFVNRNKQMLIDVALAQGITLTLNSLRGISGPQIPLDMMDAEFLNALREELFSIDDIIKVYDGFKAFYTVHTPALPADEEMILPNGEVVISSMPVDGWVIVNAENATANLIRCLRTQMCLNALHNGLYDMSYVQQKAEEWGPKSLHLPNPDLIEALNEERITVDNLNEMSYEELGEAISENRYPHDVSYGCH